MRPAARKKADYVQPHLSEARVDRLWKGITESKVARDRRVRPRWLALTGLAAAAAIVLAVMWTRHRPAPTLAGTVVDTASPREIVMPDGTSVALESATRLAIVEAAPASIRLRLDHGRVTCDVPPHEGRRFLIETAGAEVEVKGTRFSVEVGEKRKNGVAVHVERGVVEIRQAGGAPAVALRAGQAWESDARLFEPPNEPAPPPPADSAEPEPSPSATSARKPLVLPREEARAMFERADAARVAGRLAESAAGFDQLWRRYPNDPRAGLAAAEAGRIRLHTGNPRAAAEEFAFAASHSDGTFREDAEAGRVEALARSGSIDACRTLRDAFIARYPKSPHREKLATECP